MSITIYWLLAIKSNALQIEAIVNVITARKRVWIDTMMKEEVGLIDDKNNRPVNTAVTTFVGFNTIGLILLMPFVLILLMMIVIPLSHNIHVI
jgi:VIT family